MVLMGYFTYDLKRFYTFNPNILYNFGTVECRWNYVSEKTTLKSLFIIYSTFSFVD